MLILTDPVKTGSLIPNLFTHQIHGLASPIRFLLEVAGVDYEEERYTPEDKDKWFNEKKESLGNYWI